MLRYANPKKFLELSGYLLPWLWLGQWLHVGKNATMGMGGYALQP